MFVLHFSWTLRLYQYLMLALLLPQTTLYTLSLHWFNWTWITFYQNCKSPNFIAVGHRRVHAVSITLNRHYSFTALTASAVTRLTVKWVELSIIRTVLQFLWKFFFQRCMMLQLSVLFKLRSVENLETLP